MSRDESFSINEKVLKLMDNPNEVIEVFFPTAPLDEGMHFSGTEAASFFNQGVEALEGGDYQTAFDRFSLLTSTSPEVSNFWIGLGSTFQAVKELDKALYAFKMGVVAKPYEISGYIYAAHAAVGLVDFSHALEILELGLALVENDCLDRDEAQREVDTIKLYLSNV
jgi:tetratricopeptide (TPR) repeat protein